MTPDDLTRTVRTKIHVCGCGCWTWQGSTTDGYAKAKMRGKTFLVHRYVFERANDVTLDDDDTIDHLCDRHRLCVNPDHMEVVSRSTNSQRANRRRWHDSEPDRSACTQPDQGE